MLTYETLAAALEESEITPEQIHELLSYMEEHGIELVGAAEEAGSSSPTSPT